MSAIQRRIVDVMDVSSADVDKAFADTAPSGLPAEAEWQHSRMAAPREYKKVEEGDTPDIARMVKATIKQLDALRVPTCGQETVAIRPVDRRGR